MPRFVQFLSDPSSPAIMVEIASSEESLTGPGAAGPEEWARVAVVKANETFRQALGVARASAEAFFDTLSDMENVPDQAEITFGLKAVGELGNLAVAKAGAEASYSIRLLWNKPT